MSKSLIRFDWAMKRLLRSKARHDRYLDELRYEASTLGLERKVGQKEGLIKGREEGLQEGLTKGREKGLQEGLTRGQEEGKAQAAEMIAATLLSNVDITVVSEATGLSIEDLQLLDK